ncbi:hypothetical protein Sme01_06850 [Sphaerisporangium melleum]|uniref:DUF397 domain-containing protein n=1 Tax=Sphaerisporangium melleum TaxID=321316 RepID=A0A917VG63_9ACTN|nr:DUF397 domain-containing protein [Sphaerisporangium melleum]GGK73451.1 hypothetical protein GCM10007964_15350 [Sphaerisporangium melleum]GII68209.1 hypothetical protein Sme01_06850 [Sphaerisporangium melleum]
MEALPPHVTGLEWRKSTFSGSGDECVEVAVLPSGRHAVRDSKRQSGPLVQVGSDTWAAFVMEVKEGRL